MFSATMPQKIIDLAKTILTDPVEVKLAVSKPAEKIQQSAYICYEPQKLRLIEYIFKSPTSAPSEGEKLHGDSASESLPSRGDLEGSLNRVIIFVGKKSYVKDVTYTLKRRGFNAEAMHSDLSQPERDDVMWRFKTGKISVLVATDIVARGIDIDDIQLVINFDVPRDCEDYVHRIGRTARANRDGRAITLVSEKDQPLFRDIERFLEKEITKNPIPEELGEGPEYTGRASGGNERGGKRKRRGRGGHGRGRGDHGKDKHSSNSGKRTHGRADRPRSEKTKSEKPRNNNSTN